MATYNGGEYIAEQISSILFQLHTYDELIISDDGSSDATIEIINSFKDDRIKLYFNDKNNHILNFENALSKAKGNYIFLSDQDDIWLENKLQICIKYLRKYDLVLSDYVLIGSNKEIISTSYRMRNVKTGFWKNYHRNSYTGCCMAFNQKILKQILPFPVNIKSHDHWIGLVAEMCGKTLFINQPLIFLRRHDTNFSRHSGNDAYITGKSPYKIHQILFHRLILMYQLIIRRYGR
jgi:glycosyltransferase involved in cell wall biosynthesis